MSDSTTQTTAVISRPALIAALAGEDVCRTCRGRGRIEVSNERDHRDCPMCRGRGLKKAHS